MRSIYFGSYAQRLDPDAYACDRVWRAYLRASAAHGHASPSELVDDEEDFIPMPPVSGVQLISGAAVSADQERKVR